MQAREAAEKACAKKNFIERHGEIPLCPPFSPKDPLDRGISYSCISQPETDEPQAHASGGPWFFLLHQGKRKNIL